MTGDSDGGNGRGQTAIDFLVAMGVFLLTVGFVVGFLPGMLAPFGTDQEHPTVADRSADALAGSLVAEAGVPGELNTTCTLAFFGAAADSGCPFDAGDPLAERIGVDSQYRLNVTLERGAGGTSAVLCTDGSGVEPCGAGGTRLAVGPPSPGNGATTAVRTVRVDEQDAVLLVRVW